jgi:hypothetical protein
MELNDIEQIKKAGFSGFKTMRELFVDNSAVPPIKGVYLVLNPMKRCEFLTTGTGGHYKGKNPNVPLSELKANWIDDSIVVYIGKAGGEGIKATLRDRLKQYLKFGQGKSVAHWGGRFIWQLRNSADLLICWKALPDDDPKSVESELIALFKQQHGGRRPFANLQG